MLPLHQALHLQWNVWQCHPFVGSLDNVEERVRLQGATRRRRRRRWAVLYLFGAYMLDTDRHELWHAGAPSPETYLQHALAIARDQQAKSYELRAAMSLSRLWTQQGKREAARQLLAPIYGWCKGFARVDWQEARQLLRVLES